MRSSQVCRQLRGAAIALTGLAVALGIAACGGSSDSTGSATNTQSAKGLSADGAKVDYVPGVQGDAFFATTICGAEAAAEAMNVDLEVQVPPQFSAAAENPILEGLLAKQPAGMIVFPDDPNGVSATLKRAMGEGVKVITLSADVEDKTARDANVAIDLSVGGEIAARELAKEIGEEGQVMVMNTEPGVSSTDARQKGFERAIAKYPKIEYLGVQFDNNDANRAASIMSAQLNAHPDLNGVYATNIFAGEGAAIAIKREGKTGQVKLISHDTAPPQVEELRNGEVQGLIGTNAFQFGYQSVKAMVGLLSGGEAKYSIPQEVFITTANLDDPKIQQQNIYKESCG